MTCKICSATSNKLFNAQILNKYKAAYFQCSTCGFIQTETPYWINEAYKSAITSLDIGLVARNLSLSVKTAAILTTYFDKNDTYLDYGGGYGLFVRLMRDKGFNYYREDRYCENLFAQHFDINDLADTQKDNFALLSTFEVFEHLIDPLTEIEKMFTYSPNILFSTELQPQKTYQNADDWWYFSPETGQHIAFYTQLALEEIARKFNKNVYSDGISLHLLADKSINKSLEKVFDKKNIWEKIKHKIRPQRYQSLIQDDYQLIKKIIKNN